MNKGKKLEIYKSNLESLVETINRDLQQTQDYVYCEASPEIILGVCETYREFVERKCRENLLEEHKEPSFTFNFYHELSQSPISKFTDLTKDKVAIEITERLLHAFRYINRNYFRIEDKGINPNSLFGVSVFGSEMLRLKNPYNKKLRKDLLHEVTGLNWDYICSNQNRKKIEKDIKEFIYSREKVINRKIDDLFNNSLQDKPESRRKIAVIIADYHSEETIDYDSIVERERRKYESVKQSLDKALDDNAPEFLVKKIQESLRIKEYILSVLESEKNFLDRYLRS